MTNLPPNHPARKHKNECHVSGVLSQDPQLRPTKSGKSYCRATVETKYKDYREFIRICAWDDNAGQLSAFRKGDFIQLVGRWHTNKYTNVKGEPVTETQLIPWNISDGSTETNMHGVEVGDHDLPF